MTFEEILDHAIAMLQRRGRLTYGTLKRQFQLDDAALDDLKNELIKGQRLARDEDGEVLVWTGAPTSSAAPAPSPPPAASPAPVAHEDHAVRACYAALALQTAMQHYAEKVRRSHGLEMQARVGLNSGEVVVRAIGNDLHMDYSAVGQTTHLAARMEQLATPGSIRLTAATLRLVEGLVQVNALGRFPVKGLTDTVEVFELIGASAIRGRLQAAAARGLTRFVGRQHELTALQQALAQAGAGHGQVVAIVGEAGVGKSRLVYEFVHWRDCVGAGRSPSHHTPGWSVLESASVSYGKATPYFPVLDLLKRYGHIEDHDDTRTMRAKLI